MSDTAQPWLRDDTPTKHRIVRVIFFLTSFSWSIHSIQDYSQSTPIEKLLTRMLPMMIVALYVFTCEHRDRIKTLFHPSFRPLVWYLLIGILCGFTGYQPALTLWKGFEIFITLAWLFVSCRDADSTKREFIAFTWMFEVMIWATIVLALINPSRGFIPSYTFLPWIHGYLPLINPNGMGFICVWVLARLLFLPAKNKPLRIAIASLTLLCAQSRTSYAVVLCALVIYIIDGLRTRQLMRVTVASFFALMGLALAFGWLDVIMKVVTRGENAEDLQSLSGRTNYWSFAFQYVSWFGNGLATGSRELIFMGGGDVFRSGLVGLHNSYLEALMGAGYIGGIPFIVLLLVNAIRQGLHSIQKPDPIESIFLVYTAAFIARGMTSISLALFSSDFILFMMFYVWLYTRQFSSEPKPVYERPKPRAYEKTLREIEKESEKIACQSDH
ncbi:MAG: O-antigen ligase family protein [Proteobacteria bacterium]|nr:O-antigen ligase family protein [Pseudomonadota bacterium]